MGRHSLESRATKRSRALSGRRKARMTDAEMADDRAQYAETHLDENDRADKLDDGFGHHVPAQPAKSARTL